MNYAHDKAGKFAKNPKILLYGECIGNLIEKPIRKLDRPMNRRAEVAKNFGKRVAEKLEPVAEVLMLVALVFSVIAIAGIAGKLVDDSQKARAYDEIIRSHPELIAQK